MKPLVSVVIPAYNSEKTISRTLASVLCQTMKQFEIIVVDDGSTDHTYDVVKKISAVEPSIRLYQNTKNSGVAETRNIGCQYACGKYIAFLDSDDLWDKYKLETQLKHMESTKCDISYTSYYIMYANCKKYYSVPSVVSYNDMLKENVLGCSTVMLRSELMKKYSFESSYFHEDYALWLTLLRDGYKASGIDDALTFYQLGGRSNNKLKAARHRWIIYHYHEKLSPSKSLYYLLCYLFTSIKKRL